jgi:hypothetical protein
LREAIKYHRPAIEEYINTHVDTLPAITVREVRNKLTTGKK